MDKRLLAILGVIAAVFIGIAVFTGDSDNKGGGGNGSSKATSHIVGEGQKGVTFMEYGDFQCPACLAYEPILQQVRQKYAKDIYFQFRHLPLVSIHPNAFAAARATEAAAVQNKFWEMHDLLYDQANWQAWTTSQNPRKLFEDYARQLGLDVNKFNQDYASDRVNDAINADVAAFKKTGRDEGTPSFFLNGRHIANSQFSDNNNQPSLDKISAILDAEIAKKR